MRKRSLLMLLGWVSLSVVAMAKEMPGYIANAHQEVIRQWINSVRGLRVATDSDCKCEQDLVEIRKGSGGAWMPNSKFHPYYVVGDFNGDGKEDFAVVAIDEKAIWHLAVFNGPLSPGMKPSYASRNHVGALFFGAPRPKPYRLVVGDFGTEGIALVPTGATYTHASSDER